MKDIINFIGSAAEIDKNGGGLIWGVNDKAEIQMIAQIRGWGAIQNLFKDKTGKVDFEKAEDFQDRLGRFIADAITEKIQREKL